MTGNARLRDSIKERFIEMWGVDTRSEVERAMVEQETDWVLALIAREVRLGKIEELKKAIEIVYGMETSQMAIDEMTNRIAELEKKDTQ